MVGVGVGVVVRVGTGISLMRETTVVPPSFTCTCWLQTSYPSSRSSTVCMPMGTFSMTRGPCDRVFPEYVPSMKTDAPEGCDSTEIEPVGLMNVAEMV